MTWENERDTVEFRRRASQRSATGDAESGAWARLWVGIGALLVMALAYPFYEYAVASRLAERDLQRSLQQMRSELAAVDQAAASAIQRQQVAQQRVAHEQRLAAVRVMGVSDSGGIPTLMVDLQGLGAAQAVVPICSQARVWLRRPVQGELLRIRAVRGTRPAQDAGSIRCVF